MQLLLLNDKNYQCNDIRNILEPGSQFNSLAFDTLQRNVCDVMKEYFTKNTHGKNTRNGDLSVKLPLMKTEFGRKGLYFLAAKEFNSLPIQARKVDSRLLFRQFFT